MFMKKQIMLLLFICGLFTACSSGKDEKDDYKDETLEMGALEQELGEAAEMLEEETVEMTVEVDSLLEGI